MIRLFIILVIVLYLLRALFRLMYPRLPAQTGERLIPLRACDYCGRTLPEDKGSIRRERFFCGHDHAQRYFL